MNFSDLMKLVRGKEFSAFLADLLNLPGADEWRDVFQLMMSASAAEKEGKWRTAESIWEKFIVRVETIDIFLLQLIGKKNLADAYNSLGKDREAMALYAQIIGISSDPNLLRRLESDTASMKDEMGPFALLFESAFVTTPEILIASSFRSFVSVSFSLPDLPLEHLYAVLDEGLQFVEKVGHPEWAHAFREERADLLEEEGKIQEALNEAKVALSMRRHDPDGPGISQTAI